MPRLTRRRFLQVSTQAAVLAALPRPLLVDFGGPRPVPVPPIVDPDVKKLAQRAVDACRSAGASYADVRLTHTYNSNLIPETTNLIKWRSQWVGVEQLHVGVRVLVNGYWGFASSATWSPDEMDRVAKSAMHQATATGLGKTRTVDLTPVPTVVDGHWSTPVKLNPFAIDPAEVYDVVNSVNLEYERYHWSGGATDLLQEKWYCSFVKQSKAFASTEGSYCTQDLYRSSGVHLIYVGRGTRKAGARLDFLSPAGVGFELYRDRDLITEYRKCLDELDADLRLPIVPLDIGRYNMVIDARGVASLVDKTLGRATQLDRALGYEANAGGTSYLNDPLAMLGSYKAGAETVNVSANRSEPGGCATVGWDDDGVVPEPFTLVKDGVLADFQTTRESARWLQPYYDKQHLPVRSHGCAAAPTALETQLIHTPNLALAPGHDAQDFDSLVGTLKSGIAMKSWGRDPDIDIDFQCLNGLGRGGVFYKVRNGKCVGVLETGAFPFRAPELWKSVLALGGASSVRRYGMGATKGEPPQEMFHSVTAPPALFKDVALIDITRKA